MSVRALVLASIVLVPLVAYLIIGTYALWQTGWLSWLGWIVPACLLVAWLVARFWRADPHAVPLPEVPLDWTPQDRRASKIVEQFQRQVDELTPKQLTDAHFYWSQSEALALALARHYHPEAKDPLANLTVPEILTACHLIAEDLEKLTLNSLPGSRMLTLRQWKALRHVPKWWRTISHSAWAASILLNPINAIRYGSTRAIMNPLAEGLKNELLVTAYLQFIRQTGFYLIELNSGRLRGGADEYRRHFGPMRRQQVTGQSPQTADRVAPNSTGRVGQAEPVAESVVIAVVGQVSAGKSSLINALIGDRAAEVDVLPETQKVNRYTLSLPQTDASVVLLDTPGYGVSAGTKRQQSEIQLALQDSHLVLWVLAAHTAAKSVDQQVLETIEQWEHEHPQRKPAPRIAVLSHVDLLPPVLEWEPPYAIDQPTSAGAAQSATRTRDQESQARRAKIEHIHDALAYNRQLFGGSFKDIVPVCTAPDEQRRWGVHELLVPALLNALNEAKAVAALAAFEGMVKRDQWRELLKQAGRSGRHLVEWWVQAKRTGRR